MTHHGIRNLIMGVIIFSAWIIFIFVVVILWGFIKLILAMT